MSSKQLALCDQARYPVPTKVSCEAVGKIFKERRVVFILQYSIFAEIKDEKTMGYTALESSYEVRETFQTSTLEAIEDDKPSFGLYPALEKEEEMEGWGEEAKSEKGLSPITSEAGDSDEIDNLLGNLDLDLIQKQLA
jgi:hypothetical protein